MAKVAKKRAAVDKKFDATKLYSLPEALALVKDVNTAKFNASVDVHVRLGIDPRKADQALRGTVSLSAVLITNTRLVLPVPCGNETVPRKA